MPRRNIAADRLCRQAAPHCSRRAGRAGGLFRFWQYRGSVWL